MPIPGGWYTCRVEKTGADDTGNIVVFLNEQGGQFSNSFIAYPPIQRETLSIALTAISTGLLVEVLLDWGGEVVEGSTINRIHITR